MLIDRVAYQPERLKQLGEWAAQKNSAFTLEDRMGLVSDAMVLAKAGVGATSGALDLIANLKDETERASSCCTHHRCDDGSVDCRPCVGEHHCAAEVDPKGSLGATFTP